MVAVAVAVVIAVWFGDTARERARLMSSRGQSDVVHLCMSLRLCFFRCIFVTRRRLFYLYF